MIYYTNNTTTNACEVCVKGIDFRTIIALAMLNKTSATLAVNFEVPDFIRERDFMISLPTTNGNDISWKIYENLSQVFADFSCLLETECEEIYEIFNEDFVKRIDSKFDDAQNDAGTDTLIKYMNCMLAMTITNASWNTFSQLIKIGEALIEEEIQKAVKKYSDIQYLATQRVDGKIMILDKAISFDSITSYIDVMKVEIDYVVFPCKNNGGYKYSAIPITENSEFVRKAVPEQLYRLPIAQIRGITGAGTLVSVDSQGRGGICQKYEDAVKLAKLAVSLTK